MLARITDWILGEKVANSETRHRPGWFPRKRFDHRILGERLAVLSIPPHKPPYRRHQRLKLWACTPGILGKPRCANAIVELDLDEREVNVDLYR